MVMSENLLGLLLELWTLVYKINQSTESTGGERVLLQVYAINTL